MADPPTTLTAALIASGAKPAPVRMADFFEKHPDLKAEVVEAREAGFSWTQIAGQLQADFGFRPDPANLRKFVENQ